MYRVREDGSIKSQDEVKQMYVNTSFPDVWSPELVENLGLDPILESPAPTTTRYQTVYKDGIEQNEAGQWVWKWAVDDMDSATAQALDDEQAKVIRATRDNRLAECDWVVIKAYETNTNIPAIWEIYRQQLRDVPQQSGFPWEVIWPSKP